VKLRGRTTTPDKRRGRTLSPSARGAKQTPHHGPLQRLLGVTLVLRSRLLEDFVYAPLGACPVENNAPCSRNYVESLIHGYIR
jgi:hypothetical protein